MRKAHIGVGIFSVPEVKVEYKELVTNEALAIKFKF
jgi:hypothetical protein